MSRGILAGSVVIPLLTAAQVTVAQLPARIGSEFQVTTFTVGSQAYADVARDADGDFVVVWHSYQDGGLAGIFGRRFASAGNPLGIEFQLNTYTTNQQVLPAVAIGAAGGPVVTWSSFGQDGSDFGVFARRFNSTGAGLGGELQVNSFTTGRQEDVAIAAETNGDFVVIWDGPGASDTDGIFARRFNSAGTPQAVEFRVNTTIDGTQRNAAVGMDMDGDFVVVWESPDVSDDGVFAQRFSSSGASVGPQFQVNTYVTNDQAFPSVSLDSDGDFVIAFQSEGQDAGTEGIFARRFDSAGTPTGAEFQVNTYVTGGQGAANVASDRDGDFVIGWGSPQDGSSYGIFARRFKSPGVPTTGEIPVNTYVTGSQIGPEVAADGEGDFVVVWTDIGRDGDGFGIFGQRFDVPMLIDIDGDGAYLPLTDGLLLVRFGFGFSGATLVSGAVGQECTRCDGAAVAAYLQSLL